MRNPGDAHLGELVEGVGVGGEGVAGGAGVDLGPGAGGGGEDGGVAQTLLRHLPRGWMEGGREGGGERWHPGGRLAPGRRGGPGWR